MSSPRTSKTPWRLLFGSGLVLGGLALVVAWFVARTPESVPAKPRAITRAVAAKPEEANAVKQPAFHVHAHTDAVARERDEQGAPPTQNREPHPLDEAHRRIQRANQLNQAANDAMDSGRVEDLRRVLEVYREHDPNDESGLQLGYGIIADCLENPSPRTREAGERFIAEHRVSILRRFVRRHCVQRG